MNKLLLCSLSAFALVPATAIARPMTEIDLATLKRLGAPATSPDGKWVVYQLRETDLEANKGRTDLYLLDLTKKGATPVKIASAPDKNENSPVFSAKSDYIYYLSNAGDTQQVWRVATAGGTPAQVTSSQTDIGGFSLSPTNDRIAVWMDTGMNCNADKCPVEDGIDPFKGSGREYDHMFVRHWDTWHTPGEHSRVFVLPLSDGKASGEGVSVSGHGDAPSKPFGGPEEIAFGADGKTIFVTMREAGPKEPLSTNLDIWQWPTDGGPAPINLTATNEATDTLPTPSPDGKWLAYAAMKRPGYESDRQVLMIRDLASGNVRALTEAWDRSVASIAWAPNSLSLVVTAQDTLDHPAFRVDLASGKVTRLTQAGTVNAAMPLADGSIVYTMNSLQAPDDLYRSDKAGKVTQLTQVNAAQLAELDPVTAQRFSFAGANGDTVWGQILKPADATDKLPVAFLVHGGPQGSFGNGWSFRWNPKLFAAQGFAAVTVDFHGSTGYGQAFTDSINRDWGGKPLQDLKLGLAAAGTRDAQVDTANACALGASYGGYMMNWIEGQWPDAFKCLVQHDGVFDARAMAYETEELWFDEWEHGGKPYYEAPEEYEKWNPVNHVAKWKTPMLVITGEKDFRIPYTQGLASFTALQRRDIPSKLLVFPDENHWVLKPKNSIQWHRNVFEWIKKWTGQ